MTPRWNLELALRDIARRHNIPASSLRNNRERTADTTAARREAIVTMASMYPGMSPARIGRFLGVSANTVRAALARSDDGRMAA